MDHYQKLNPDQSYPESIISVGDVKLKNCDTFKYLGCKVNEDQPNTGDYEIEYRISCAKAAFAENQIMLKNQKIRMSLRILFLNALVKSRLTYGCQTWNLSKVQSERLNVVYRGFLRRMIKGGFRRKKGTDGSDTFKYYYTNEMLHGICKSQDICIFIKTQQTKYTYHVIRSDWSNSSKRLLFNADKYKKRGRHLPTLFQQVSKLHDQTELRTIQAALNRER